MKNFTTVLKRHSVTIILVLINIIVFIADKCLQSKLSMYGMLASYPVIENKEYWRVITAGFIHINIEHLVINVTMLTLFSTFIEQHIGKTILLITFMCSSIGGQIASLIYKTAQDLVLGSVGASGAIFGLTGFVLIKTILRDNRTEQASLIGLLILTALSLYEGFASTNIDNASHVGGLLVGIVIGTIDTIIYKTKGA